MRPAHPRSRQQRRSRAESTHEESFHVRSRSRSHRLRASCRAIGRGGSGGFRRLRRRSRLAAAPRRRAPPSSPQRQGAARGLGPGRRRRPGRIRRGFRRRGSCRSRLRCRGRAFLRGGGRARHAGAAPAAPRRAQSRAGQAGRRIARPTGRHPAGAHRGGGVGGFRPRGRTRRQRGARGAARARPVPGGAQAAQGAGTGRHRLAARDGGIDPGRPRVRQRRARAPGAAHPAGGPDPGQRQAAQDPHRAAAGAHAGLSQAGGRGRHLQGPGWATHRVPQPAEGAQRQVDGRRAPGHQHRGPAAVDHLGRAGQQADAPQPGRGARIRGARARPAG